MMVMGGSSMPCGVDTDALNSSINVYPRWHGAIFAFAQLDIQQTNEIFSVFKIRNWKHSVTNNQIWEYNNNLC